MLQSLLIKQGEVKYVTEELTKTGRDEEQLCLACRLFSSRDWGGRGLWDRRTGRTQRQWVGRGTEGRGK